MLAALDKAILYEVAEVESIVAEMDSESTLKDHMDSLRRLGSTADVPIEVVEYAVKEVERRIKKLDDETEEAIAPAVSQPKLRERNEFDDMALNNLFASLLADQ